MLAELERGERPNVSLESALVLLQSVGVTMRLTDPAGNVVDTGDELTADMQRAIRAVRRRATWTGRRVHQHEAGEPPAPPRSGVGRLAEVTRVSASAFALARRGSAAR